MMAIIGLNKLLFPAAGNSIEAESKLFADKFLFWFFILTVSAILLQLVLIGFSWKNLPPLVPLFYSKPWSNDILAKPIFLWILPGFSVLILVLNSFLSIMVSGENKFLNRIFAFASLFVCMAILFGVYKIITLVV